MSDFYLMLTKLSVIIGSLGLLWMLNLPRSARHGQRIVPLAALSVLAIYVAVNLGFAVVENALGAWLSQIQTLLAPLWYQIPILNKAFALPAIAVLVIFVLIKLVLTGFVLLLAGLRRLYRRLLNLFRKSKQNKSLPVFSVAPAYCVAENGTVQVKLNWLMARRFAASAGLGLALLLLLTLVLHFVAMDVQWLSSAIEAQSLLLYTVLALVFLELGWYLGGPFSSQTEDSVQTDYGDKLLETEAPELIDTYRKLWPNQLLASGELGNISGEEAVGQSTVDGDQELDLFRERFSASGVRFDKTHLDLLNKLTSGHNLVIHNADAELLLPAFFIFLSRRLVSGSRVLFALGAEHADESVNYNAFTDWIKRGFEKVEGDASQWSLAIGGAPNDQDNIWSTSLASLASTALSETANAWLDKVNVIVFFDAEGVTQALAERYALSQRLRRFDDAQRVVMAGTLHGLESAYRENLCLSSGKMDEYTPTAAPISVAVMLWATEVGNFQGSITKATLSQSMGAAMALAVPGVKHRSVSSVMVTHSLSQPTVDFKEALENAVDNLKDGWKLGQASSNFLERIQPLPFWSLGQPQRNAMVIAEDHYCNTPLLLRELSSKLIGYGVLHILSHPYLLRDYFAANARYFMSSPLKPLSPRVSDTASAVAERLMYMLIANMVPSDVIRNQLKCAGLEGRAVLVDLVRLYLRVLKLDILQEGYVHKELGGYRFDLRMVEHSRVPWKKPWQLILVDGHQSLGSVRAEHAYQTYLPGQLHTFNGKLYLVENMGDGQILFKHQDPKQDCYSYRTQLNVSVVLKDMAANREKVGSIVLHRAIFTTKMDVDILGFIHGRTQIPLEGIPKRSYEAAKSMIIKFEFEKKLENSSGLSILLAAFMQEILRTLMPSEVHLLVILPLCHSSGNRIGFYDNNNPVSPIMLLPEWQYQREFKFNDNEIGIILIEDSYSDIGAVQAIFDDYRYVLEIIQDYLIWLTDDSNHAANDWTVHRDKPLMDVGEASQTLLDKLNDFLGRSLRADARQRFYDEKAENPLPPLIDASTICNLCGAPHDQALSDKLPDGRIRCPECKKHEVLDINKIKQLYADCKRYIEDTFDVRVPDGVGVIIAGADVIGNEVGLPFNPSQEYSGRAIGFARQDQDGKWTIYVESNLPKYMLCATLVHELVHIWQFKAIDLERAPLMWIEGHASWVEHAYLESKNAAPDYRKHIRERNDPIYGEGYRIIVKALVDQGDTNPFRCIQQLFGKG
ncbi:hypothetical protein [Vibrio metschnikovii]|uniref:hypothetical protein n=1 Tax=Vibrio metschnikovii TaxID=28172 RepID=UPI001C2FFFB5|nr:hypothetical protein [Vibrio metschnikovii]